MYLVQVTIQSNVSWIYLSSLYVYCTCISFRSVRAPSLVRLFLLFFCKVSTETFTVKGISGSNILSLQPDRTCRSQHALISKSGSRLVIFCLRYLYAGFRATPIAPPKTPPQAPHTDIRVLGAPRKPGESTSFLISEYVTAWMTSIDDKLQGIPASAGSIKVWYQYELSMRRRGI